jgi:hypothetical protein
MRASYTAPQRRAAVDADVTVALHVFAELVRADERERMRPCRVCGGLEAGECSGSADYCDKGCEEAAGAPMPEGGE